MQLHYLGKFSKDFPIDNMEKTEIYRYVYDFSVDYDDRAIDYILDIHKYFNEKEWYEIKRLDLLKKYSLQQ